MGNLRSIVLYWECENGGAGVNATGDGGKESSVTSEVKVRTTDLGIEGLSGAVHLGAGGSANVFAARNLETGEEVAVKLLRASADSEKERTRFEREQQTLATLAAQDGIVPVLDAGLTDREEPYFLMPLMQGSLQDRIDNDGPLDWQTATQLIVDVADTVEFAHSQKVLHRDLKPGNILLDSEGVPRVADFGIAKLLDSSVSKSSKSLGTPSFMPPERFNGHEATAASDVYGLAATLSALITGSAPFLTGANDTDAAVMMRVINEAPPSMEGHEVPEAVVEAMQAAMSKDPADRPQSASEFAFALRGALDPHIDPALAGPVTVAIPRRNITIPDGPVTSSKGATIELGAEEPEDEPNRKLLVLLAAALFALIVGGGAALALTSGDDKPKVEVAGESQTAGEDEVGADNADSDLQNEANSNGGLVEGSGNGGEANVASNAEPGENEGGAADPLTPDDEVGDGGIGDGGTGEATPGDGDPEPKDTVPEEKDETPGVTVVEPTPPNACFRATSTAVKTGVSVSFTNCSTNADTYSWDLDPGTKTSTNASTSWSTAGTKTVWLTARGSGMSDPYSMKITVTEDLPPTPDPVACFHASPTSVETGHSVTFSNCSSNASSYSWSFGDGTTSSQLSPSKSWTTAGTKTVRLTATGAGGTHTTSGQVTVTSPPPPPDACFTASTTTVDEGKPLSFSNCSTNATSYEWDFGDHGSSTHVSPSHTFTSSGSYTVRLTADGVGGSDSATRTITVNKVNTVDPNLVPQHINCTTLGPTEWSWTWSTLPAWVDDYLVEFNGGSRVSVGKQPPAYQTTNTVARIIAVKDGNWSPANVPACDPYTADPPSGVSCRFSNFRYVDTIWTWTETWSWNNDPSVDHYEVLRNVNGSNSTVGAGRGTYTTDPSNGQPNSGYSVKQIIAVDGDGNRAVRGVSPCGNEGGSGWQNPT